ncbi:hypothetical protein ACIBH1_41100 [Nonomuraea sp. NPDC050663]|uniref:hypothetical protein n=1 Tax=Nonomuraea sp. NPDC050663 TaxID=3364370 RepID=UPI0037B4AB8F
MLGRTALAVNDARTAAGAFREVLRLDPGADHARDLLVEALKRGNPLYRWLSRLSAYRASWRLIFLLPAVPPVILVFVLVMLAHWAAWVAEALSTLRLARGSYTRLLLERGHVRAATLAAGLLPVGAAVLAAGVAAGGELLPTAGVAVLALVTPVLEAAYTGGRSARRVLAGWAALLAAAVVAGVVSGLFGLVLAAMWGSLATIWLAVPVRRLVRAGTSRP